jgi:cell division protein ZapA
MSEDTVPVSVHILEKEYRIACPPEECDALRDAASYLNEKMREIRDGGRVVGVDRVAVMAALNITHEFLHNRSGASFNEDAFNSRIRSLQDRVETALNQGRQLNL